MIDALTGEMAYQYVRCAIGRPVRTRSLKRSHLGSAVTNQLQLLQAYSRSAESAWQAGQFGKCAKNFALYDILGNFSHGFGSGVAIGCTD